MELRREQEKLRAARARKHTKVKKIPRRFVSVNKMYPIDRRRGRKYLSPEGSLFKEYLYETMLAQDANRAIGSATYYDCHYVFFMDHEMLFKKGDVLDEDKEKDVSNLLKATEDGVFEYLLENDCLATDVHGHKRLTLDEPKVVVLLSPSDIAGPLWIHGQRIDCHEFEHANG